MDCNMKRRFASAAYFLLFLSALVNYVRADDSLATKFVSSPLLILAAFIVIDIIAFVFRRIRK